MWKTIKEWALKPDSTQYLSDKPIVIVDAIGDVMSYSQEVKSFLEKAYGRYCKDCDRFFDRAHALMMHRRFKHTQSG